MKRILTVTLTVHENSETPECHIITYFSSLDEVKAALEICIANLQGAHRSRELEGRMRWPTEPYEPEHQ